MVSISTKPALRWMTLDTSHSILKTLHAPSLLINVLNWITKILSLLIRHNPPDLRPRLLLPLHPFDSLRSLNSNQVGMNFSVILQIILFCWKIRNWFCWLFMILGIAMSPNNDGRNVFLWMVFMGFIFVSLVVLERVMEVPQIWWGWGNWKWLFR